MSLGFPGGAQWERTRLPVQPTLVFSPGKSHRQRRKMTCAVTGHPDLLLEVRGKPSLFRFSTGWSRAGDVAIWASVSPSMKWLESHSGADGNPKGVSELSRYS